MPFDSSGVFTPLITFVDGTPATAGDQNSQDQDIASGLTDCMTRDGLAPATANQNIGGFRINGVGPGVVASDAANVGQALSSGWGGTSAGTANAQTITVPGFAQSDGQLIYYIAGLTNTLGFTLTVNGGSPVNVLTNAAAGNVATTGYETTVGSLVGVRYLSSLGKFILEDSAPGFGLLTPIASATTTNIGTVASHLVQINGTTTITSFGSSASVSAPVYRVIFAASLTLTHNATSLFLPGQANIVTQVGDEADLLYLGSGNWRVTSYSPAITSRGAGPAGATGVRITNNTGTPNTSIDISWGSVTLTNASGSSISFGSGSATLNSATSGSINQWDAARPTSAWGYIYLISDGATVATLGSASSTSPTLPTGYTLSARIGAMRFDGSQNLLRTLQVGARAEYVITAATNTANLPLMASGAAGSTSVPTWVAVPVGAFVPSTTSTINVTASTIAASQTIVAPNNAYGTITSSAPPPITVRTATGSVTITTTGSMILQSANIYWASDNGADNLFVVGWTDGGNIR